MTKITKKEKRIGLTIILGILVVSLLENPISNFINSLGISDFWLVVIGIIVIFGIFKWCDF